MFVQDGATPLVYAMASGGQIEVVRLLLDRGAELQGQNKVSERVMNTGTRLYYFKYFIRM